MGNHCYVYAAIEGASAAMPAAGMPEGSPPRLVTLERPISLVVSDVPSSVYNTAALEARLTDLDWVALAGAAHHSAIDGIAETGVAVLPFRLFTIFSSEAKAIATLRESRDVMGAAFDRVRGRQEWVLRIGKPDPTRIGPSSRNAATTRESGTNFLQAKADARRDASARAERVRTDAAAAAAALEPLADAVKHRSVEPAGNLLLDTAFLVPSSRVEQMQHALTAAAARLLDDGCPITFTGPWPPYSFGWMDSQHDG